MKRSDAFAVYLKRERGLSPGTIAQYKRHINLFLSETFRDKEPRLANLKVSDVNGYVKQQSGIVSRRVANMLTTALRSFFKYARYQGYIESDLSTSVPADGIMRCSWSPFIPDSVSQSLSLCSVRMFY